ncbi:MAG: TetR/AcrR family transcriptional regulator [Acidimicrobiales bacterium]
MPRPKQRTDELRRHILQTAVGLIAADGVAGFTTRRVVEEASTSIPAMYELFGDKSGLVREIFFEGFRLLRDQLDDLAPSADPRADLVRLLQTFRRFYRENPVLARVMFSRPFPDFDPGPAEEEAGRSVREHVVGNVQRAIEARTLEGNPTDIAHVILSVAQGMATVEVAGWLGTSKASVERRWKLAIDAVLDGLRPPRRTSRS